MRPVGIVLKALVGLIAAPPRAEARAGEVRLAVVLELLPVGGNRASTVGGPTVLATDVASCSIVRVAEASACAAVVVTRACATGAAPVTGAGGFAPAAPCVVEVGSLSCTCGAALVTGAAAFVTSAVFRITGLLVFAADAAVSSAGTRVPGAGPVAF
jgi:hypothetical protein